MFLCKLSDYCFARVFVFPSPVAKPVREILLSVDNKIPTEQQVEEFTEDSLLYLNDVKNSLEKKTEKSFCYIFSGNVIEGFGIPLMISMQRGCCGTPSCRIGALNTDLDIMFFTLK